MVSTIDVKRVAGMLPPELLTAPWRKAVGGNAFGTVQRRRNQGGRGTGSAARVSRRAGCVCGIAEISDALAGRVSHGDENCNGRPNSGATAAHGGDSIRGRSFAMPCRKGDAVGVGICAGGFRADGDRAGRMRTRRLPTRYSKRSNSLRRELRRRLSGGRSQDHRIGKSGWAIARAIRIIWT